MASRAASGHTIRPHSPVAQHGAHPVSIKTEHVGPSDVSICSPLRVEPPTGWAPGQPNPEHQVEKLLYTWDLFAGSCGVGDTRCHLGTR